MSAGTYFYCPGVVMEKASIQNVTSSAAGYEPVNAIDFNPTTYWRPSSNVAQDFKIDLGTAKQVDNLIVVFQNYDTAGAGGINLYRSDDDSTYTTVQTWLATSGGAVGQHVKIYGDISTAGSHRYWNVYFDGSFGTAVCVNEILLCRRQAVSYGSTAPETQDNPVYLNSEYMAGGGVRFVYGKARSPVRHWRRNWAYATPTILANIQQVHNWSFGRRFPFVFSDDINQTSRTSLDPDSSRWLCRFNADNIPVENPAADFWNASLDWTEEYYIRDGETY